MRYYAVYNAEGNILSFGIGRGGVEITLEEYNTLLSETKEKNDLVDKLYNEEIALNEIPFDWQEEVWRRVNYRIKTLEDIEEIDILDSQVLSIILGNEVA